MPTNPTGYNQQYFRRERKKIIEKLGGKCAECGADSKLEIHHIKPCGMGANRGTFRRLTEWKRNMDNLQVLCHDCHKEWHKVNGVRYNGK